MLSAFPRRGRPLETCLEAWKKIHWWENTVGVNWSMKKAHYAIERLSKHLGKGKAIIVSKYCSFPREFPMAVLPEHLGNMNTQRHMTLTIKLVLVSQDKCSLKDQMSAWGLVTIFKVRLIYVVNRQTSKCKSCCSILVKWYVCILNFFF